MNLEKSMNINIFSFYILFIISSNCYAEAYKCTNESGEIKFQDKPCAGMKEEKIKTNSLKNSPDEYSRALESVMRAQLQKGSITDSSQARVLVEPVVKAASLKTYTKNLILEEITRLCSTHLPSGGSDIKSAFEEFSKSKSDELVVGKYVYEHGLINEEEGWNFTPAQLAERVKTGKEEQQGKYTIGPSNSKKIVVSKCEKQQQFLVGAVKYGL
jgi:hypothetical protein